MLWFTKLVARSLNAASYHFGRREPDHLRIARRGEMEAYFYLRDHGYRIVARNFRTPHNRGEIDLIGWELGVLCFVEVKTHAHAGLVPPEMAVDAAKQHHILSVARRYVRRLPGDGPPRAALTSSVWCWETISTNPESSCIREPSRGATPAAPNATLTRWVIESVGGDDRNCAI